MFWCWSYVWSYVLMLVLCSDALWPFLSVLLNICVCGSMIVCCTHSAAFCVYVWQTWTSTVMAKKSISWRSPPSRQCAILYSVVSYLLCVLLWITHGGLIISVSLMIWILWILWSEFSYVLCQPCQTGLFMRSAFASQCYYDGASGQGESASQSQRLRGKPWVQCIGNVYMYMQMRVSNFCGLLS